MGHKHLTEKQQGFCTSFIENGGSASNAYRANYETSNMQEATIHVAASQLLNNHKVAMRIDELKAKLSESTMVTLESHTATVQHIMNEALAEGHYSPAISGATLVAKMHGLIDKKENIQPVQPHLTGLRMRTYEQGPTPGGTLLPGGMFRAYPEEGETLPVIN